MKNLNLLVLRCKDIEKSKSFYMMFDMMFTKHSHGGPEHYCHFDDDGPVIELYPLKNGEAPRGEVDGLGFREPFLELKHAQLSAMGYAVGPITESEYGDNFVVRADLKSSLTSRINSIGFTQVVLKRT